MPLKKEFHIPVTDETIAAVELLAEASGFSRQKVKRIMQQGCVWHEQNNQQGRPSVQRLRRAKKVLKSGEVLHCYYDESVLSTQPAEAQLIHDALDYSIWNKPSGMLSQGSKWGDHCTINRWVEKHLSPERPAFVVHRLDRAASGLIILAHKKKMAATLANLFQERKIEKHYHVRVNGDFSFLMKGETVKTVTDEIDNKKAVSHIRFLTFDSQENESLLDVHIETGRKHQIRKHLAGLGFSVVADRLYGAHNNDELKDKNLQLMAVSLVFICPLTGENKTFKV